MTPTAIHEWLKKACPGDRVTYHTGHLISDRERHLNGRSIAAVADILRAAQEGGRVALTQRRIADDLYQYVAERTGVA
jgi:hypothetical protein